MENKSSEISDSNMTFESIDENTVKAVSIQSNGEKSEVKLWVISSDDILYLESVKERIAKKRQLSGEATL